MLWSGDRAQAYSIATCLKVAPSTTSPCIVLAMGELLAKAESPTTTCAECLGGGGVALVGCAALATKLGSTSVWKKLQKVMSRYFEANDRSTFMSEALSGVGLKSLNDLVKGSSEVLGEDMVGALTGEPRSLPEGGWGDTIFSTNTWMHLAGHHHVGPSPWGLPEAFFVIEGTMSIGALPLHKVKGDTFLAKLAYLKSAPKKDLVDLLRVGGASATASAGSLVVIPPGNIVITHASTKAAGIRQSIDPLNESYAPIVECVRLLLESYPAMQKTAYKRWLQFVEGLVVT